MRILTEMEAITTLEKVCSLCGCKEIFREVEIINGIHGGTIRKVSNIQFHHLVYGHEGEVRGVFLCIKCHGLQQGANTPMERKKRLLTHENTSKSV